MLLAQDWEVDVKLKFSVNAYVQGQCWTADVKVQC